MAASIIGLPLIPLPLGWTLALLVPFFLVGFCLALILTGDKVLSPLSSRRLLRMEEKTVKYGCWRPRAGSGCAPYGSHDHYVIERKI